MKNAFLSIINVISIVSALGCAGPFGPPQNVGGGDRAAVLLDGRVHGDFGPRVGFDGDATEIDGVIDSSLQTSHVVVARDQGELGTAVVIIATNGITLDRFTPGTYEYAAGNVLVSPTLAISVCSGADRSSIDYDSPADRVSVTVADTPDGRSFEFRTETIPLDPSGVQSTSTSFTLANAEIDNR